MVHAQCNSVSIANREGEHVAGQMRCLFFYRDSLIICFTGLFFSSKYGLAQPLGLARLEGRPLMSSTRVIRCSFHPALRGRRDGEPVEGGIHLDDREAARVIADTVPTRAVPPPWIASGLCWLHGISVPKIDHAFHFFDLHVSIL
jgi:hypothetical protein